MVQPGWGREGWDCVLCSHVGTRGTRRRLTREELSENLLEKRDQEVPHAPLVLAQLQQPHQLRHLRVHLQEPVSPMVLGHIPPHPWKPHNPRDPQNLQETPPFPTHIGRLPKRLLQPPWAEGIPVAAAPHRAIGKDLLLPGTDTEPVPGQAVLGLL